VNLLDNAARAAGPHGTVVVTPHGGPAWVRVLIEDDGPGFGRVPAGSGLGLVVTRRTLAALGGSLAVEMRALSAGTRVVLSLPASRVRFESQEPVRAG
jgi:signal transduction histidine kinase